MKDIFDTTVVKLPNTVFNVPYYVVTGDVDDGVRKSLTEFSRSVDVFSQYIERFRKFETKEEISNIAESLFKFVIRDAEILLNEDVSRTEKKHAKERGIGKWKHVDGHMKGVVALLLSIKNLNDLNERGEIMTIKEIASNYYVLRFMETELSDIVRSKKPDVKYAYNSEENEASLILPLVRDAVNLMTVWNKPLTLLMETMEKFNKTHGEAVFS